MVEIIPKPTARLPFWSQLLFYLSIGLLLATILTYFILDHSLKKLEGTLQELELTLAQKKTVEEIALEKEILTYQKKIQHFTKLFSQPKSSSSIFEFIEEITHPKIWFSQIDLNPVQAQVNLSGKAENFLIPGQQLLILESNPLVKDVHLSQISIGKEGGINFSLSFSLRSTAFK